VWRRRSRPSLTRSARMSPVNARQPSTQAGTQAESTNRPRRKRLGGEGPTGDHRLFLRAPLSSRIFVDKPDTYILDTSHLQHSPPFSSPSRLCPPAVPLLTFLVAELVLFARCVLLLSSRFPSLSIYQFFSSWGCCPICISRGPLRSACLASPEPCLLTSSYVLLVLAVPRLESVVSGVSVCFGLVFPVSVHLSYLLACVSETAIHLKKSV
jgi:hypothetical protein